MFELTTTIIFIKLTLATVLGMSIGAERSIAGKVAGMRTFALVSLGSALFVIIATLITNEYLGRVNFDPMRVPAAVVTGVGFIGAGMIIFRKNMLRGLTTAAGLWIAAGVGMAVAFGLYVIAIFTTLLTLIIFTVIWFAENKIKNVIGNSNPTVIEEESDDKKTSEEL